MVYALDRERPERVVRAAERAARRVPGVDLVMRRAGDNFRERKPDHTGRECLIEPKAPLDHLKAAEGQTQDHDPSQHQHRLGKALR